MSHQRSVAPLKDDELEATVNSVLSTQMLVRKQKEDPQLSQLREQAVSEAESNKAPVCYFVKDDVLMHKWRPKDVTSSEAWKVFYQVVVPPLYCSDVSVSTRDTLSWSFRGYANGGCK